MNGGEQMDMMIETIIGWFLSLLVSLFMNLLSAAL